MSQEYDDEIRKNAQLFSEAETLFQSAEKKLGEATREFDDAKSKRAKIKNTLEKYVGRNNPRRIIKLTGGSVVVVSHESENNISVEIHSVL